jgi:hypothetical protein
VFFPFLYLGLLAFALITQLSAWLVALRRDDLPRWSRWGHGVIFLLLIPATVLDVGATDPAESGMLPWGWLLGVLFVASAMLTLRTVGPGWGERLCAWGIALFGMVFGLVYLLRYAAYLGVRLPLPLEGLVIAHAATMCVASIFLYIFFPVLNLWPLARIAPRRPRLFTRTLNGVAFVVAATLLGATIGVTPYGTSLARQWQGRADIRVEPGRDFRCGVVIRVHQGAFPDSDRLAADLQAVRELGVRAVNLFVHPAIMDEPIDVIDGVAAFARQLRADGRTVILTADYPSSTWIRNRPSTSADVESIMAPCHRFLLEHIPCDVFVPYIEPYGAFVAVTQMRFEADTWVRLLASATAEAHGSHPGVRTAVYVGQRDDDETLYRRLVETPGTVDILGISIYSLFQRPESIERQLSRVSQWLAAGGAEHEHWIFEFGQSPLTMGGERAQAGFILQVLDWAVREPAFRGACVFALADYAERMGLLASNGRRRETWTAVRDLAQMSHGEDNQPDAKSFTGLDVESGVAQERR